MKRSILLATIISIIFASCTKDDQNKERIYKGAVSKFQHGKAWTWYQTDHSDKPLRIAIAIDDAALASLSRDAHSEGGHTHENSTSLKLHPKAAATPFRHMGLDRNPHGHEPEFIYGKPHFDFHFYMISEQERMNIPPYEVDSTGFKNLPAAAYLPLTYFNPGGGVPQMGAHWLDATSPELNGSPFTQTFIYGSYNGKVNFYEPMITEEFLLANPNYQRAIPQPAKFQTAGYYPTMMRIAKMNGVTNIILEGFIFHEAS